MPKIRAPLLKRAHRGQKGITLIELLIVVSILGVIGAVIVIAVGPFAGKGHVEAANTELYNVQVAISAAMSDLDATGVTAGYVDKDSLTIQYTGVPPDKKANGVANITLNAVNDGGTEPGLNGTYGPYLSGTLKARYDYAATGSITSGTDQLWGGILWDATALRWKKA